MRKSRAEASKTREKILQTAAAEFRKHGINQTGLADLMTAAGLTHGGFYKHFASKEELVNEVMQQAGACGLKKSESTCGQKQGLDALKAIVEDYLSTDHCSKPGTGCFLPTVSVELSRDDTEARAAATKAIHDFIRLLADKLQSGSAADRRIQATAYLASMVGAVVMARLSTDKSLSDCIRRSTQRMIMNSARGESA